MKILTTGGRGFIGSHFIEHWLEKHPSDEIIDLDACTYAANDLINLPYRHNQRYTGVIGNICDSQVVDDLVRQVDAVVHFAAESSVDKSITDSSAFVKTNVLGTHNIVDSCYRHQKRLHHVSTDEVFGSLELGAGKFDENTPYAPRNPYAATKAASDHIVRSYIVTHQIRATISNCSNNYGERQHMEKLLPTVVTKLLKGQEIPVYGDGKNVREWLYVKDHCEGIEKILLGGKIGETYLLGGREYNNLEIIGMVSKILGIQPKIKHVQDRKGHDLRYAIDISKAAKDLGWTPNTDIMTGLKKTADYYLKILE